MDVFKLRRDKNFENDKIKILFSTGDVSDSLSVYLKDENGKSHHVWWMISNDRCRQSFNKATPKIMDFVKAKVEEWLQDEENERKAEEQRKLEYEKREEDKLKRLMDSF